MTSTYGHNPLSSTRDLSDEERVAIAQLQEAIQEAAAANENHGAPLLPPLPPRQPTPPPRRPTPPPPPPPPPLVAPAPAPVTDGARNPVAAGADYTSLRCITRRAPADSDALVAGLDTSSADLSWTAADSGLDPNGRPWLYPKTRGKGRGSNLGQFKEEIEERTRDGQGCKAIAEILIARGVDTSARAVSRQRMKWGLRQRAQRRMTEQGIANIRKAHLEQAKRLANSDPVPVKRVRIRVMRKAEVTRMTKEGMSSAAIAENLASRGVKFKRGAATVERMRTMWGLVDDRNRKVLNIRSMAKSHAQREQKEQFENIARELGIQDVDTWVRDKMEEDVAREARREYGYVLMGDARPKLLSARHRAGISQYHVQRRLRERAKRKAPGVNSVAQDGPAFSPSPSARQQGMSSSTTAEGPSVRGVAAGAEASREIVEVSDEDEGEDDDDDDDDDYDDGDTDDDEAEADAAEEAAEAAEAREQASVRARQQLSAAVDVKPLFIQPRVSHVNGAEQQNLMPQQQQPPPPPPQINHAPSGPASPYNMVLNLLSQQQHPPAPPPQINHAPSGPPLPNNMVFYQTYGHGREDGPQPTNMNVTAAPPAALPGRPPSFVSIAPRPSAPQPIGPKPIAPRPLASLTPSSQALKVEANYMAQFGLLPYPTRGKPPQKYLTPSGVIITDGYEYLANPPLPGDAGPPQHPQEPVSGPPGPYYIVFPEAPRPQVSRIDAPPLAMPPEEVERHKNDHKTLQEHQKLTQECMDLLAARANGRPGLNSLTGLPPSLKDIEKAKEKFRKAATALVAQL